MLLDVTLSFEFSDSDALEINSLIPGYRLATIATQESCAARLKSSLAKAEGEKLLNNELISMLSRLVAAVDVCSTTFHGQLALNVKCSHENVVRWSIRLHVKDIFSLEKPLLLFIIVNFVK